jgi:hypothetical protein
VSGMTNLEMLRTTLKGPDRAEAALSDVAIAGKLLEAATRLPDPERAQQYFLIASSTFAEVVEAMATLEMTPIESAALRSAVSELGDRLREYRDHHTAVGTP